MKNKILTEKQEVLIGNLPDEILANFYLTGGTALSAFYIKVVTLYGQMMRLFP